MTDEEMVIASCELIGEFFPWQGSIAQTVRGAGKSFPDDVAQFCSNGYQICRRVSAGEWVEWKPLVDRNTLPELWGALERHHIMGSYISTLCSMLPKGQFNFEDYIAVHTASPRLCVEAALQVWLDMKQIG